MTNIISKRKDDEHPTRLLRRFTRSVKSMGMIPHIRTNTYYQRKKSSAVKRSEKLLKINRRQKKEELYRLGKIITPIFGGARHK